MTLAFSKVAIIGAGAMGRGIAQIAAQAGSQVWLYDTQAEAIAKARDAVFQQWDKLQEKGRLTAEAVAGHKSRLQAASSSRSRAHPRSISSSIESICGPCAPARIFATIRERYSCIDSPGRACRPIAAP